MPAGLCSIDHLADPSANAHLGSFRQVQHALWSIARCLCRWQHTDELLAHGAHSLARCDGCSSMRMLLDGCRWSLRGHVSYADRRFMPWMKLGVLHARLMPHNNTSAASPSLTFQPTNTSRKSAFWRKRCYPTLHLLVLATIVQLCMDCCSSCHSKRSSAAHDVISSLSMLFPHCCHPLR